jgi:hypothetical protein
MLTLELITIGNDGLNSLAKETRFDPLLMSLLPAQPVLRGGYYHLRDISQGFAEVVLIDTSSYIKTMKRKKLDWTPGERKHWRSAKTEHGEPLDDLLLKNVDTFQAMLSLQIQRGQFDLPFGCTFRSSNQND